MNPYDTMSELMQHGLSANPMYRQIYTPDPLQGFALMGASALGYQGAQALPHVAAGQRTYDQLYSAYQVTPMYNKLNQNVDRRVGQMLGTIAGDMLGASAAQRQSMLNYGASPMGAALAGTLNRGGHLDAMMGGDLRRTYTDMFNNRNRLAYGGRIVDPNNTMQQRVGAQYTNLLADRLAAAVMVNPETGMFDATHRAGIMGGRDIGSLGGLTNALSMLNPEEYGMSAKTEKLLQVAAKHGKGIDSLTEKQLRTVEKDLEEKVARTVDAAKALNDIGDVLGETDKLATLSRVNDAFGGQFTKLSGTAQKQFAGTLSAAEKVYGVSATEQLGMIKTLSHTIAAASGGINPVTGKIDSEHAPINAYTMAQHAMTMKAQNPAMTAQDALAHTSMLVANAGASSAGRLSRLIEAGYRTGQISEDLYNQFTTAERTGDVRSTTAVVREMGAMMGKDLFAAMKDPTSMRVAEKQLASLPAAIRDAANAAHTDRLMLGPQQEMAFRSKEYSQDRSNMLLDAMGSRIGVTGRNLMSSADSDAATMSAFVATIEGSNLDDDEKRKRLNLLKHAEKQGGMRNVHRLIRNSSVFEDQSAEMLAAAETAKLEKKASLTSDAFRNFGAADHFLSEVGLQHNTKETRSAIRNIRQLMKTDPAAAQVAMSDLYNAMPAHVRETIKDPMASIRSAEVLLDPAFQAATNNKLAEMQKKDPGARFEAAAQAVLEDRRKTDPGFFTSGMPTTFSKEDLKIAKMGRNADLRKTTASFHNELNKPANKAKMDELMKGKNGLKFEEAAAQVLGVPYAAMTAMQSEAVSMAGAQMAYPAELFLNAPTADQMAEFGAATDAQAAKEAGISHANRYLRLSRKERAIAFSTQGAAVSGDSRILFTDVLGLSRDMITSAEGERGDFLTRASKVSAEQIKDYGFFERRKFLRGATDEEKEQFHALRKAMKNEDKGDFSIFSDLPPMSAAEEKEAKDKASAKSDSGKEELRVILEESELTINMGDQTYSGTMEALGRTK